MATIRIEPVTFGASRSFAGGIVSTIAKVEAAVQVASTGASQIVFGPVASRRTVLVKAAGGGAFVAHGAAPVAGPAPAAALYLGDGEYTILELATGDSVAVMTAVLA